MSHVLPAVDSIHNVRIHSVSNNNGFEWSDIICTTFFYTYIAIPHRSVSIACALLLLVGYLR